MAEKKEPLDQARGFNNLWSAWLRFKHEMWVRAVRSERRREDFQSKQHKEGVTVA